MISVRALAYTISANDIVLHVNEVNVFCCDWPKKQMFVP